MTAPAEPPDAWPRSAQLAAAFLLGMAVTLAGVRVTGSLSGATRPLDLQPTARPLDLNRAAAGELRQLPGVGNTLADRIIADRDARGTFRDVDELTRIDGVGPATLAQVRPWLMVSPTAADDAPPPVPERLTRRTMPYPAKETPAGPIDLNRATAEELQRLPGIGPVLAARIVEARKARPFTAVADLRTVKGIGAKTLAKIAPYAVVAPP
jgi:competence protein ComEA